MNMNTLLTVAVILFVYDRGYIPGTYPNEVAKASGQGG